MIEFLKKTMEDTMQIGNKLRELREDKDMTQTEIARVLDIDQSYYSKYENGIRPIPTWHLKTLCLFYGVSADYILGLPKGLNWPR